MNTNYSNASMLDMVFEHRNKAYGAYVLRRDSNKTTRQAMIFILAAVTILCFGNFLREGMIGSKKKGPIFIDCTLADVTPKTAPPAPKVKPIVQPPKPPQTAQATTTVSNTEKKVVVDNKATHDSIPTNKDLANVDPGIKTNVTTNTGLGVSDGTGNDKVIEVARQVEPAPSKPVMWCEKMPEFPGGDKALMEFVAHNIEYPRMERDNDIAGKVITQFTVNEDGTVSDIQILRSPSMGFNKEATRVIKMLPAFKPGLQQGRPVKVRFNLPIVFNLR